MRRNMLLGLIALVTALPAAGQITFVEAFNIRTPRPDPAPTTPANVFTVYNDGSFAARGVLGVGTIPQSGAGERLMWNSNKAGFRAGSIGSGGTFWDESSMGYYSWAGGYNTLASGLASLAVGYQSHASGSYSTALGYLSRASGTGAVGMGYRATATADYSVAIGQRAATAGRTGAIVMSDASTTDSLEASANNQFSVRAAGGIRLFTNATTTTGVQVAAGGSSWTVVSDRNRKEAFAELEGEDVLARLDEVPVSSWRYIEEEDRTVRHVGPMAQDWHAAFSLSPDSTTINMSDLDGVNLAGVKALSARTANLRTENARLASDLAATQAALTALQARLDLQQQQLATATARLDALGSLPAEVARLRTLLDALAARLPVPAP